MSALDDIARMRAQAEQLPAQRSPIEDYRSNANGPEPTLGGYPGPVPPEEAR